MPRSAVRRLRLGEHLGRILSRPDLDRLERHALLRGLRLVDAAGVAVRGAHELDQVVLGDRVAGLAVEDVVEPGLRAALVAAGAGRTAADR